MSKRHTKQPVLGRGNWLISHGASKRGKRWPEYNVWQKMIQRCENRKSGDYKNYGGRGIAVCKRWHQFSNFIADMGRRPSSKHTIERLDNDDGYRPGNCIWATRKVQASNKRTPSKKLTCLKGHPLSGTNEYLRPDGKRGCKACRRQNMKDYYARQKSNECRKSY